MLHTIGIVARYSYDCSLYTAASRDGASCEDKQHAIATRNTFYMWNVITYLSEHGALAN